MWRGFFRSVSNPRSLPPELEVCRISRPGSKSLWFALKREHQPTKPRASFNLVFIHGASVFLTLVVTLALVYVWAWSPARLDFALSPPSGAWCKPCTSLSSVNTFASSQPRIPPTHPPTYPPPPGGAFIAGSAMMYQATYCTW